MSSGTTKLRRGTLLVAAVLGLATIASLVVVGPRAYRRWQLLRAVEAKHQPRFFAIQEKLDAGGAWGNDELACRVANKVLAFGSSRPSRPSSAVAEVWRKPDGSVAGVLVVANCSPIGDVDMADPLLEALGFSVGQNDTFDIKDVDLVIEYRPGAPRDMRHWYRNFTHYWRKPGGAGQSGGGGIMPGIAGGYYLPGSPPEYGQPGDAPPDAKR